MKEKEQEKRRLVDQYQKVFKSISDDADIQASDATEIKINQAIEKAVNKCLKLN